jgi:6-phosphogluconolactonase
MVGAGFTGLPAPAADAAVVMGTHAGTYPHRLYFGSYGHGIGLATLDPATGLPTKTAATDTPQPSYLALSVDLRTLYAVNELAAGTISAFAVGPNGDLAPLGSRSTHGADPCHVLVHPNGRYVLTANYTSGSVAVHPVLPGGALGEATDVVRHTGSGPDPDRQAGPHAHKILTDPAARFVHAVDLGADTIFGYQLRKGKFAAVGAVNLAPGSGPRHLTFHPSGAVAYLTNELADTLSVLAYDREHGRLTPVQTLPTAPKGSVRNYPSEVVVSPDGRFVYVANRGHNSVAAFAVAADGRVSAEGTVPCGGNWPRHIAMSRDGAFLYITNQLSDQLVTLGVNRRSGELTPAGSAMSTGTPTMVLPV